MRVCNPTKILSLFISLLCLNLYSQIGVNTATPRATLDISQNATDLTLPTGIIAPTVTLDYLMNNDHLYTEDIKGVIVYVDDVTQSITADVVPSTEGVTQTGYYYFNGSTWTVFVIPDAIKIPTEPWKNDITGLDANSNSENIVHNAQVGIGFQSQIDQAAQLEIKSSSKGLLIPRLSTSERNEITAVPNSLLIYNTDTDCFNFYKKNKWKSLCGDLGQSEVLVPDCNSAVIKGDYQVGKVLGSGNYFEITVNVVEPGDFSILVNDLNSTFFFQKSGVFPNVGEFTIQIPAIGTPTIEGVKNFSVAINDEVTTCSTSVNVSPANVVVNTIAFVSADDLIRGETSSGKTMNITANIGAGGTFNFQTNSVNGLSYSANNITIASNTNDHPITLMANGNPPTLAGTFQYSITGTGYAGPVVQGPVKVIQNDADITSVNCNQANINGSYKLNIPLTASNYIDIPIVTNSTGTYNISVVNATAGFSFTGSGNINTVGTNTIRIYGTGTPVQTGLTPFVVTINGVTCTLNINVLLPNKSILLVGSNFTNVLSALNNTANFGPNGKTKIEGFTLSNPVSKLNATQLRTAINTQGVEIIMIGWSWKPNAECTAILADFINNKKGFVFITEGQDGTDYIGRLLGQIYNSTVTMTNNNYGIYTGKFDSSVPATNPYLNGVFGNAQGKYLRVDDSASWIGVLPSTLPPGLNSLITLPSNGGSGTGSNSPRDTQVYGDGFFMFSDWGMTNKNDTAYGTFSPIGFSTKDTRGNSYNGITVANVTVPAGDVANWVIFGNAMDYILKYVQQNYNPTYQVQ